jgi:hypothetical protein
MRFDMIRVLENCLRLNQGSFTPSPPSPLPQRAEGRGFIPGVARGPWAERGGDRVWRDSGVRGSPFVGPRRSRAAIPKIQDRLLLVLGLALVLPSASGPKLFAQQESQVAPVMTGRYHFLGPEDELAILQEEAMLKGFVDVFQGENESDAILSYQIATGSRNGNRVEFTTRAIHEKHYHFTGNVELGKGKKPGDPDYLQLVGVLETYTSNSVTGKSEVARQNVVFKSMGRGENEP